MPNAFRLLGLNRLAKPLTYEEGKKVLERDHYQCRYCGLDGAASFENSLVMTVDFVLPRARKGKKDPANLVAACRPCNLIKGHKVFRSLEEARTYVLSQRLKLRGEWETRMVRPRARAGATA